jgi:hypothetical protein
MDEYRKEQFEDTIIRLQEGGATNEEILEAMQAVAKDLEKAIQLKQPYGSY